MVPIAYASSEGSDEPVHLRKIVSAFRLNCEHRRNVDEGKFINSRIIAPLGGCEFENRKNSLYFNHHTSIDVCIPTFNRLVFMNSQTVCLFWKEKSSNMDGFSFHLFFFTENWKVFITYILMKTAKDLEIIRGDIHIRICKHPYHTSVDVLPRLCCMRPTKSQISLGTAHSYQRLCYEYKH